MLLAGIHITVEGNGKTYHYLWRPHIASLSSQILLNTNLWHPFAKSLKNAKIGQFSDFSAEK